MSEEAETVQVAGHSIKLKSGAKVAFFRDVEPGAHGVCFTSVDGEETRLKLSHEAVEAFCILASPHAGRTWRAEWTA